MAKVLIGTVMVGTLSLSGVVAATAGPVSGTLPVVLSAAGPDIAVGNQDSTMVVTPDGSRAYVANAPTATITVYELPTGAIAAVIPLPGTAYVMTASRDGSAIFASTVGSAGGPAFTLATVSTATNTLTSVLPMDSLASSIAETGDGTSILVLGQRADAPLYVIDKASGTLTKTISMTALDSSLASLTVWAGPNSAYAYITRSSQTSPSTWKSDVLVIDINAEVIVRTIEPCGVIMAIAFTSDGTKSYIGCSDGKVVTVDTSTGAIVGATNVGSQVRHLQLTNGGSRLVAAGNMHRQVTEIDTGTNEIISVYNVSGAVHTLAAPLIGNRIWYLRGNDNRTIDLTSLTIDEPTTVEPLPPLAVIPPSITPTTEAPATVTTAGPEDPALAATGSEMLWPSVGVAMLMIVIGGAVLRRRKLA